METYWTPKYGTRIPYNMINLRLVMFWLKWQHNTPLLIVIKHWWDTVIIVAGLKPCRSMYGTRADDVKADKQRRIKDEGRGEQTCRRAYKHNLVQKDEWAQSEAVGRTVNVLLFYSCACLTSIFKSSLNELKDSKQGIFGQQPPPPIKALPVFSMAALTTFMTTACLMRVFVRFTWHETGDHNSRDPLSAHNRGQ